MKIKNCSTINSGLSHVNRIEKTLIGVLWNKDGILRTMKSLIIGIRAIMRDSLILL